MSKNTPATEPQKAAQSAATAPVDRNHGKGGVYRMVDGKRELVARTEPAKEVQPKQGA